MLNTKNIILIYTTYIKLKLLNHLKECNYNGPMTMELVYRNDYLNMDVEDFYKKGLSVGKKLEEMYYGNNL